MAYTFTTSMPATPAPGIAASNMKTGDIGKIVAGEHKGATILRTPQGFVSLSNPTNKLGRFNAYNARVELLPKGAKVTLAV